MEDAQIIQMFWDREEAAIKELDRKYNQYCFKIAWNILNNREDSEECVNDTWLRTWNYIPPKRPAFLTSFVGKITRGLAIDCLRKKYASKRMDLHIVDVGAETEKLDSLYRNRKKYVSCRENSRMRNLSSCIRYCWNFPSTGGGGHP